MVVARLADLRLRRRQQRLKLGPLPVGQLVASCHPSSLPALTTVCVHTLVPLAATWQGAGGACAGRAERTLLGDRRRRALNSDVEGGCTVPDIRLRERTPCPVHAPGAWHSSMPPERREHGA